MLEPWLLPGFEEPDEWREGRTAAGTAFRVPVVGVAAAQDIAARIRRQALQARRERTTGQVIEAVAAAATRLAGEGPEGVAARELLRQELGWDAELARTTLRDMAHCWAAPELHRLVDAEVRPAGALDRFVEDETWTGPGRRLRRAAGPPVILQVLAGNVPGVSITAVVRSLLVRSGVLCKVAEPEPALLPMFGRLLAEEDELLGRTLAVTWWPGGEVPAAWRAWVGCAGRVVVYGGDRAVEAVRRTLPASVDLVAYGPRTGIGVILADSPDDAAGLARDVWAYDQQGCVSPRLVYVVGRSASDFGGRLAEALEAESRRRPPPAPTAEEAVAIRELRASAEFESYAGEPSTVRAPGESLAWTVLTREQPDVGTDALPRVVQVHRVEAVEHLLDVLAPLEGRIQAVGYSGTEGLDALREGAAELGVSRVAPLGTVAWPPPDWRHEGRHQLLPLLDWTDFEATF